MSVITISSSSFDENWAMSNSGYPGDPVQIFCYGTEEPTSSINQVAASVDLQFQFKFLYQDVCRLEDENFSIRAEVTNEASWRAAFEDCVDVQRELIYELCEHLTTSELRLHNYEEYKAYWGN